MKQVTVNVWCDSCQERGRKTPATTTPPLTVAGPARTLDLCDPCGKSLVRPLVDLLDAYGVAYPPKGADAAKGAPKGETGVRRPNRQRIGEEGNNAAEADPGKRILCPVGKDCPTGVTGALNYNAWTQHVRARHGLQIGDAVEKYGRPMTVDGTPVEVAYLPPVGTPQDADPHACGFCEATYPPDKFSRAWQSLAAHRSRRHGWFPGKLTPAS